jgi:hypothetical protein
MAFSFSLIMSWWWLRLRRSRLPKSRKMWNAGEATLFLTISVWVSTVDEVIRITSLLHFNGLLGQETRSNAIDRTFARRPTLATIGVWSTTTTRTKTISARQTFPEAFQASANSLHWIPCVHGERLGPTTTVQEALFNQRILFTQTNAHSLDIKEQKEG